MFTPVATHLARLAAAEPGRAALWLPRRRVSPTRETPHDAITFAKLDADATSVAAGLSARGLVPGERVAVLVPPSWRFFALAFGLLRGGFVPVLIDPGMGVRGLGRCLTEANPAAFVGTPKAQLARRLLRWRWPGLRLSVRVGFGYFPDVSLADVMATPNPGYGPPALGPHDPAAILYTSGSTGPAKGVLYTHGLFAAQVESLKAVYGIEPGEVDLCTFPLFALFGPALGMSCVLPDLDATRPARADPRKLLAQARQFGVTNLFASPAILRNWANTEAPAPPTLRRVISAGAPATAKVIAAVAKRLPPGAEVFTPYGATEALPVANVGGRVIVGETAAKTAAGAGVCLGFPVPGMTVAVIAQTPNAIPEWYPGLALPAGEIGEFAVRGPVVTAGYFAQPEATRRAKMRDPATGELWHRMGDVGYFDDQGRMWFCGRKAHVVWTSAGPLYPDQVEPVLNEVAGVFRTALVGVMRGGVTHPVVCVEPEPAAGRGVLAAVADRANLFPHTRGIVTFLRHRGFPVDVRHNSKIFREELAAWADRKLGPRWKPAGGAS